VTEDSVELVAVGIGLLPVCINSFSQVKCRRRRLGNLSLTSSALVVVQAVARQLQALDSFFGSYEQAEAQSGSPAVAVTVSVV
jgi:hypothetical protein